MNRNIYWNFKVYASIDSLFEILGSSQQDGHVLGYLGGYLCNSLIYAFIL